jgi:mannosyltransferase OCH1-like enzyme
MPSTQKPDAIANLGLPGQPKDRSPKLIPKIIHQLWKDDSVPEKWSGNVDSVKRFHPGWEYRLWTDAKMEDYVREQHPELFPTYIGFSRHIMRVDVFRYVLLHDIGGLYCDLDFEFLRPYDYADAQMVFSLEADESYGDPYSAIANFFMVSVPGHPFWADVLDDIKLSPPVSAVFSDIPSVTGPGLISKVFFENQHRYEGVVLTPQPTFSPRRLHGRAERKAYINSGVTYGFHHGWGTWKERWSLAYVVPKIKSLAAKWLGIGR